MLRASIFALLLLCCLAQGVIVRLLALDDLIKDSTLILEATVETLDAKRPSAMLAVARVLKGKAGAKKLPVLLKGDPAAVRRKEPAQLVERLAPKLKVVLFVSERGKELHALGYCDGTWFALAGSRVDGETRWVFGHLEPYLQRTYKGGTDEMLALVADVLAGKKKAPKPDPKAKPGIGPKAKPPREAPARGVIPAVLVGGPLAMLALLFPAVFAGWQRWLVLLATVGTSSTVLFLHWWFAESLARTWIGSPVAVWLQLTLIHLAGLAAAWSRHQQRVQAGQAPLLPGLVELALLGGLSAVGLAALAVLIGVFKVKPASADWWPLPAFVAALTLAAAWGASLRLRGPRLMPAASCESVVLLALVGVSLLVGPRLAQGGSNISAGASVAQDVRLAWSFRLPVRGAILSSPLLAGDRVYLAAAHEHSFTPWGALYCLDRATGEVVWQFDDGKKMKQGFSSPVLADGKLYFGEGLHQDSDCRLFCLDARTGEKLAEFATLSHTEATPVVAGGGIYVGAGDDGLYRLDLKTLKKEWNFPGHHIDTGPVVVGGAAYGGAGVGDFHKDPALFRLDARTGKPAWRKATALPVWTEVAVSEGRVYAGLGNGRINEAPAHPTGLVLCLDAATGEEAWRKKLPDGILGRLALDRCVLYFGTRDGRFYCLRRSDGAEAWSRQMPGPIVAGAALDRPQGSEAAPSRLYVATLDGVLAALVPGTGAVVWQRSLGDGSTPIEMISRPAVESLREEGRLVRRIYAGLTLKGTAQAGELRCYEDRTGAE